MMNGKCGCGKKKGLCPISLGLALGITSGLAIFLWSIWVMYYGMPTMMADFHMPIPTWSTSVMHALLGLVKGFVFGVVLALFYDLFACCFKSKCKPGQGCGCGCTCCSSTTPEIRK
jgi:hypothetical protein